MKKQVKRSFDLVSVIMLVAGIALCFFPETSMQTICVVFGVFLLVYAAVRLIIYFFGDRSDPFQRNDLVTGVLALAGGIFVLVKWQFIMMVVPIALGIFILITSLATLQTALDLKRTGYPKWWMILVMGLVGIVLGVILLFRPFGAAKTTTIFIGITFIVVAITNLWQGICTRNVQKKIDVIEIDSTEA